MTKANRARRVWLGIGVLIAVQAAAIGLYLLLRRPEPPARFAVEELSPRAAPALSFERTDGSRRSLDELRGKVVLVHFWATWCEPCLKELPGLLEVAGALERSGNFAVLAVSIHDEWSDIREFFAGEAPGAVVRLDGGDDHRRFGVSLLPDTYLVDASGELVLRYAGARDWRIEAARVELERALQKYGPR